MTVREALDAYGRYFGELPPFAIMPVAPDQMVALVTSAIERGSPLTRDDVD
jgi:hypothetical protein